MTSATGDSVNRVITTAVVNDYEVIVRGVAAMLADEAGIQVVELDTDQPVARHVDIALYDAFGMPSIGASDIDEMVAGSNVGRVVLYTWRASAEQVEQARASGLAGVIAKGESASRLVELLHRAHRGEFVTSTEHRKGPPKGQPAMKDWPAKEFGLSAREAEVIGLITQGLSNQEIARRMFVSINSIKSHVRTAYRTMGVTSRSQAVLWGIEHGLAPERMRVLLGGSESAAEIR